MFKRSLTTAAVLAAALIWSWGAAADDDDFGRKSFTDLYAFGDSLTDTGNLFALTGTFEPPSPPYFDGRFSSDALVYVDQNHSRPAAEEGGGKCAQQGRPHEGGAGEGAAGEAEGRARQGAHG